MSHFKKRAPSCSLRIGIVITAIAIPAAAQRDPLFKTEILPVLEKNCVQCHCPRQKMAKLDLSSFTGMMLGSSSGPVLVPGKPERSLLWKLIEKRPDAARRQADPCREAANQVVHTIWTLPRCHRGVGGSTTDQRSIQNYRGGS
jgi:Planctomycete cytochrome C